MDGPPDPPPIGPLTIFIAFSGIAVPAINDRRNLHDASIQVTVK
jgi:hypothetical protein